MYANVSPKTVVDLSEEDEDIVEDCKAIFRAIPTGPIENELRTNEVELFDKNWQDGTENLFNEQEEERRLKEVCLKNQRRGQQAAKKRILKNIENVEIPENVDKRHKGLNPAKQRENSNSQTTGNIQPTNENVI